MIFTDWTFFVFFAAVSLVYWDIPSNSWRKIWLLAASCVFYAAWDWRFLGLVLLVIVNTYIVTLTLTLTLTRKADDRHRRAILTAGIVTSLGVLGFFKYFNFFAGTISSVFGAPRLVVDILLPVGISFYTFHSLSYMIDTYRRKIIPTRNVVDVALYILFFPQLVAGPIVRATDLLPQMRELRSLSGVDARHYLLMFLVGYFKKAVISDNVVRFVDPFFSHPAQYGGGDALLAVLSYTTQIYCDFSGYTDMAIAVAGLLGYQLKPNFNHPYLAANLIDFWRRWHISLSFWLRDYLYFPLGGNRGGSWMQARNIAITMLLGGFWHGAAWTFVAWGGLHGVGLIGCHAWRRWQKHSDRDVGAYSLAGNLITFSWVTFAWIFFRATSFTDARTIIQCFGSFSLPTLAPWQYAVPAAAALVALHVSFYRLDLKAIAAKTHDGVFAAFYGAAVAVLLPFINVKMEPFIYFQF
jgi:D-alanyl-lipoteichoic acid acyltransferase DltB (MBOAT superfamily)